MACMGRRDAHQDHVFATPPSTLLARGTQVGPPHCRWRRRIIGRRAGPARYGKKHSTGVKLRGFGFVGLALIDSYSQGYRAVTAEAARLILRRGLSYLCHFPSECQSLDSSPGRRR